MSASNEKFPIEITDFPSAITKSIFTSCNNTNTDKILVSKIIEFITPFMQQNISELLALTKTLDPNNTDPLIDSQTFFSAVSDWASQIIKPITLDDSFNYTLRQPKQEMSDKNNFNYHLIKRYTDSTFLNHFNVSSQDIDRLEQLTELEFQNQKMSEEIVQLKGQLSNYEEQNQLLHEDIEKLKNTLHLRRQIVGKTDYEETDDIDIKECLNAAEKRIRYLEKQFDLIQKENVKLGKKLENAEEENNKLEDALKLKIQQESDIKGVVANLEMELFAKDQELFLYKENNVECQNKLEVQQKELNDYIEINHSLKAEKAKLENYVIKSSIFRQSFGEYTVNLIKCSNNFHNNNSSLKAAPAQNFNSSVVSLTKNSAKLVDNNDTSTFMKNLHIINCSTPEKKQDIQKTNETNSLTTTYVKNKVYDVSRITNLFYSNYDSSDDNSFLKQIVEYSPHDSLGLEMSMVDSSCFHLECKRIIDDRTKNIEELQQELKQNDLIINYLMKNVHNSNLIEGKCKTFPISTVEKVYHTNVEKGQKDKYKHTINIIVQEIDMLSKDIKELKSHVHYAKSDMAKLGSKINTQETTTGACQMKITELEKTMKTLEDEFIKTTIQYRNVAKKENWAEVIDESVDFQDQLSKLRSKNNANCKICAVLKLEVDKLQYKIAMCKREDFNIKNGNFNKLQIQLERMKLKVEMLEELLIKEKCEKTKLSEEKLNILQIKMLVEEELKATRKILEKVQNDKQELEIERNKTLESIEMKHIETEQLKQHNENLKGALQKIQNDLQMKIEHLESSSNISEPLHYKIEKPSKKKQSLEIKSNIQARMQNENGILEQNFEKTQQIITVNYQDIFQEKLDSFLKNKDSQIVYLKKQLAKAEKEALDYKTKLTDINYFINRASNRLIKKRQIINQNMGISTTLIRCDNLNNSLIKNQFGDLYTENKRSVKENDFLFSFIDACMVPTKHGNQCDDPYLKQIYEDSIKQSNNKSLMLYERNNTIQSTLNINKSTYFTDDVQISSLRMKANYNEKYTRKFIPNYLIRLFIGVTLLSFTVIIVLMMCLIYFHLKYPWKWVTWTDIFGAYMQKSYWNGPPPT